MGKSNFFIGGIFMQKNLKTLENNLVPVYETGTGEKVVYGTELYLCIGSKRQYTDWIKDRFSECDAIENEDFESFSQKNEKGGRPKTEYIIKLDTAKEMAMLERNEKGKQVRRYFIQVEKKYKEQTQQPAKPLSVQEQIRLIAQGNIELEQKIDNVKQDLEQFKQDMPVLGIEESKITSAVRKTGVKILGGKDSNAYNDKSLRSKLYSDIYRELKRQFDVTTYKAIKRSQCDMALSIIETYKPPLVLEEQIQNCNAQMQFGMGVA